MIDSFRAERQLELLLRSCRDHSPGDSVRRNVIDISTVYYWPNRPEMEVVPYGGENVKT